MPAVQLASADGKYGIEIPAAEMGRILLMCEKAGRRETGGLLIGVYSERLDHALVRVATGPALDSRAGGTWFERGTKGLQDALRRRWREGREYYVGEWHFHPAAAPNPSGPDVTQMIAISLTDSYKCPEPILLIVGGDPAGEWAVSGHVFPRNLPPVAMTSEPRTAMPLRAREGRSTQSERRGIWGALTRSSDSGNAE